MTSPFSQSYEEARSRFRAEAAAAGCDVRSYSINSDDDALTIDVAMLGTEGNSTVVISSGLHGVEGFFGSAVQLALLQQLRERSSLGQVRYTLLHGLNPYGFANLRRTDEVNVDLNRNYVIAADGFCGAPDGYGKLDRFLNPCSPPSSLDFFRLRAAWLMWRHGLQAMKDAVARGQYEYPQGLFFGGHGESRSTRIVQANCDEWVGEATDIVHIDLHSGLGQFGAFKLLVNTPTNSPDLAWFTGTFTAEHVESVSQIDGTSYESSGSIGKWMEQHFEDRRYRYACAEFGTYGVLRMLAALRAENRAHHYATHHYATQDDATQDDATQDDATYTSAKRELLECFCPTNSRWRQRVIASGIDVIQRAAAGINR